MLSNLGSCYDSSLNPQVNVEFNIALRDFHYFIGKLKRWRHNQFANIDQILLKGEKVSTYDESLFKNPNGIRGIKTTDVPLPVAMDNLTFAEKNQCGLTHGQMDMAWNIAGVGQNV